MGHISILLELDVLSRSSLGFTLIWYVGPILSGVSNSSVDDDKITFSLEVQPIEGVYLRTGLASFEIAARVNDNKYVAQIATVNVSRNYDAIADLSVDTQIDCTSLPM